jgi:hypothetical protein
MPGQPGEQRLNLLKLQGRGQGTLLNSNAHLGLGSSTCQNSCWGTASQAPLQGVGTGAARSGG